MATKVPTDPNMTPEVRRFLESQATALEALPTTLGTAAAEDVGTGPNNVVQLDASSKLPAVDGSALTNLPAQAGRLVAGTNLVLSPFTTNSTTTQAHGLGVAPVILHIYLTCLSNDLNYVAGDVVTLFTGFVPTVKFDATNLVVITCTTGAVQIQNATAHTIAQITAANWSLTIVPYKLT